MPVVKLKEFLDQNRVKYVSLRHSTAYTAQEIAASAHVKGRNMAKTVVVKVGDRYTMLVLCASCRVVMSRVEELLGGPATMATERELEELFPDGEVGAEPPFGSQYGMKTYADATLKGVDEIVFRAGSHDQSIKMKLAAYEKVEKPTWGSFAIEQF